MIDKSFNRRYLLKLRIVKAVFYPVIIFLDKFCISESLTRHIDKLLRKIGVGKSVNEFWKYKEFGKLFRDDFRFCSEKKDIVLFPGFLGVNSNFTMINLMIAKHFLSFNLKPLFIVCRSSVPLCQKENVYKTRKHNPFMCHECSNGYRKLSEDTGIQVEYFDRFIDSDIKKIIDHEYKKINKLSTHEQCRNFSFNGRPVGDETLKNVLRYFLKGTLDGTRSEIKIFKKYLKSAVILSAVHKKIFDLNNNIKYTILHNGTLAFETITRSFCELRKIPYMTYENYMGKNTLIYKKNGEVMNFSWEHEYEMFKEQTDYTPEMQSKVDQLFTELQVGKHAFGVLNKKMEKPDRFIPGEYVCLFTNVNFDTAVLGKHTIFKDMTDWLMSVVNYWSENVRDMQLVIRVHPAEIVMRSATSEFMGDYLKKIIKTKNITLIDSNEEYNSYDLIKNMKFGLVYSSTIGMEIAYRNKICVVAGKPYYRGKSFVISPVSKQEYFLTLDKLFNKATYFQIDKDELNRFIYFIFYNRLKYLNGIVIYTIDSEPHTMFEKSNDMISGNMNFLNDFTEELLAKLN